jgi:hypothetical protein
MKSTLATSIQLQMNEHKPSFYSIALSSSVQALVILSFLAGKRFWKCYSQTKKATTEVYLLFNTSSLMQG